MVLYRGEPLAGVNPHATIVFQTFALYPWLTVQENVEVALKARGVPPAERTTRAVKLIDTVGLDGFESAYPARAVRRHAPEGGLCPGHGGRAGAALPGRAVLRAGRAVAPKRCAAS